MTWNYRIVEYADGTGFGVHEVHYNRAGREIRMTKKPAAFVGDSPEEVRSSLIMARTDAVRRAVFQEPKRWSKRKEAT